MLHVHCNSAPVAFSRIFDATVHELDPMPNETMPVGCHRRPVLEHRQVLNHRGRCGVAIARGVVVPEKPRRPAVLQLQPHEKAAVDQLKGIVADCLSTEDTARPTAATVHERLVHLRSITAAFAPESRTLRLDRGYWLSDADAALSISNAEGHYSALDLTRVIIGRKTIAELITKL
jgi:hypothetical protein